MIREAKETDFEFAFRKYRMSDDYARAYKLMSEKGFVMPYIENILYGAFSGGYNHDKELGFEIKFFTPEKMLETKKLRPMKRLKNQDNGK